MPDPEENRPQGGRRPPPVWPDVSTDIAVAPVMPDSLNPRNLQEAMDLSKVLAVSGIVPYHLQGKPADILVIMMYGMELGLSINGAMRGIHVINGTPSLSAELRVSKTRERGHRVGVVCGFELPNGGGEILRCSEWADHPVHGVPTDQDPGRHPFVADHTPQRCTVKAVRKGSGETSIVTWTIQQAIDARLIKRAENGNLVARSAKNEALPWELYPEDMLYARAAERACKRIAPEVAYGLYTEDEVEHMPPPNPVEATVGQPVDEGPPPDADEARRQAQAAQDEYLGDR